MLQHTITVPTQTHKWEDYAHHGSPIWECKYCDTPRTAQNWHENCQLTTNAALREAITKHEKEQQEYNHIKYLLDKFQHQPNTALQTINQPTNSPTTHTRTLLHLLQQANQHLKPYNHQQDCTCQPCTLHQQITQHLQQHT